MGGMFSKGAFPIRAFWVVVCAIALAGCSARSNTYSVEPVLERAAFGGGTLALEKLGYDAQLAGELFSTPTNFEIPYPDASYAFERGRIFFERFGGGVALTMRGKSESVLGARTPIPGYRYSVSRRDGAGGAVFSVTCVKFDSTVGGGNHGEPDNAGFRCKNLARFIRSGQIEDRLVTERFEE
jgi:hypothetical protein